MMDVISKRVFELEKEFENVSATMSRFALEVSRLTDAIRRHEQNTRYSISRINKKLGLGSVTETVTVPEQVTENESSN